MTSDDPNRRFKYPLQHGQAGLSVAFDMPILMGIDRDNSHAHGEVGPYGVAISSLADMDSLFEGIPLTLNRVTTSMMINEPAASNFAIYLAVAEKRGSSYERLGGTTQNDILKEYIARKNGFSHLNPHCGSSPTLSPTVRNRLLNGIRSVSVARGLSSSKAVEPRET
jgi:methylmalonyl-CoA mutase N-terminal domain/subunit